MLGEPLMCVWQAAFALDDSPSSGLKKEVIKNVTESMKTLPLAEFKEKTFDDTFIDDMVGLAKYKDFLFDHFRKGDVPWHLLSVSMEDACWEICHQSGLYTSNSMEQEDVKKLWKVFNRISVMDSYTDRGPLADREEILWVMEKTGQIVGKELCFKDRIPLDGVSFSEFLELIELLAPCVSKCVQYLHSCLVEEILIVGWAFKRSKKQGNWTSWAKHWIILTPGCLQYYEREDCQTKKGEFLFHKTSLSTDSVSEHSGIHQHKIRLSNGPGYILEMSVENDDTKQKWMKNIQTCVRAASTRNTPISSLLSERASKRYQYQEQMNKLDHELSQLEKVASSMIQNVQSDADAERIVPEKEAKQTAENATFTKSDFMEIEEKKIKLIFARFDIDGNGKIDQIEFQNFITELGLTMNHKEVDEIFQLIDEDGNGYLFFDEFYKYFLQIVLGNTASAASESEARLCAAFLSADRDGSGAVSFQEFAETVLNQNREIAVSRLMEAFNHIDKDGSGEICNNELKIFLSNESYLSSFGDIGLDAIGLKPEPSAMDHLMKKMYAESDADELVSYLKQRWKSLSGFKRKGSSGSNVMTGRDEMVDDFVPGEYSLLDLACYNDLPPIEPKHVVVKASWVKSMVPGKSGQLCFSEDFTGELPTEIATNETLAYYGCSYADGNQLKVSLLYRHGIQDFTYENDYLEEYVTAEKALGGAGLEIHGFAHLDCPLDPNSGHFILGKFVGDDLHLTAFKIPNRHTLYVPPFTVHSNDYLKGTWRTMLSDEAEIDHVQLIKMQDGLHSHFSFSFQSLVI